MSTDLPAALGAAPPVVSSLRLDAAVGDPARLAAVAAGGLLEPGPQRTFDRFARLASRVADVPVALVSVVADDRQYFAGQCGLAGPAAETRQTPLSHSFCQHVVATASPLVVEDARADPVLCSNLAIADLGVIAYAGFPIVAPAGQVLGSLCAIDHDPRCWSPAQLEALADIAVLVGSELERRDLIRRLGIDARTDVLTGLANRRAWEEELPTMLMRADRLAHPLAAVLLDVDHFKAYNDRFGHPAGDRALRELGARWGAQLRAIDLLARVGGEEFGLLLPGCDADAALEVVARLRAEAPSGLTASAGIVVSDGSQSPDLVVAAADQALYEAKRAGRDRAVVGPSLGG